MSGKGSSLAADATIAFGSESVKAEQHRKMAQPKKSKK
jgi:hypothetical protein